MPYVYLDVLKQVEPITGSSTSVYNTKAEAHFVIFGSCDYLYYGGIFARIAEAKAAHEKRHQLCWKYERQPVFLYCSDDEANTAADVFSNSGMSEYPLVLSLLQMDKVGLGRFVFSVHDYLELVQNLLRRIAIRAKVRI